MDEIHVTSERQSMEYTLKNWSIFHDVGKTVGAKYFSVLDASGTGK